MVQTFLVEETKELIYDVDKLDEWKQRCEELGLSSQLALAKHDKSPIPFENMNLTMNRVYITLCPMHVNYKDYGKTAIPLEVLALIALAEKEGYFDEIMIWYDDKSPDPLVVGKKKLDQYHFDLYLIARWGDVLRPFEELKKMATKRFLESAKLKIKNKIADLNNKLAVVDTNAQRFIEGEAQEYEVSGW